MTEKRSYDNLLYASTYALVIPNYLVILLLKRTRRYATHQAGVVVVGGTVEGLWPRLYYRLGANCKARVHRFPPFPKPVSVLTTLH